MFDPIVDASEILQLHQLRLLVSQFLPLFTKVKTHHPKRWVHFLTTTVGLQVWFVQHQQEPPTETLVIDWSNNYGPYPMKVSCHEESEDVFLLQRLSWIFFVCCLSRYGKSPGPRLAFGEMFCFDFCNCQICKSKKNHFLNPASG